MSSQVGIWSYGAQVSQPIFTAGSSREKSATCESQHESALIAYRQTIQRAFGDVSNALIGYEKLHQVRVRRRNTVKDSQESVRLSEMRLPREAPPLISKSWTANARSFRGTHARGCAALMTRVSCSIYRALGGAGSNSREALCPRDADANIYRCCEPAESSTQGAAFWTVSTSGHFIQKRQSAA